MTFKPKLVIMLVNCCMISDSIVISVSRLILVTCVMVVPLQTSVTYAMLCRHIVPLTDINDLYYSCALMDIGLCHDCAFTGIKGIGSHDYVCMTSVT